MLTLSEISSDEYGLTFPNPCHLYNTVEFAELNSGKVDRIIYLVIKDEKDRARFGIIFGETDGELRSPFSAPFGGIETSKPQSIAYWLDAIDLIKRYATDKGCRLFITLPPAFYSTDDSGATQSLIMSTSGFADTPDYNYHFPPETLKMSKSAVKNLHTAERANLIVEKTNDISRAYDIIRTNRAEHGYPLKMSLEQVKQTVKFIPADFWVVSAEGNDIAAAQVFHVTNRVAQVIYWGDVKAYSHLRPMNLLAYGLATYYNEKKMILDVGPASSDGIPSLGLCDFKKNIGCELSPKHRFSFSPSVTDNFSR